MNNILDESLKKRGRKPKNVINEEIVKKKRGRKKKYEIENSEKITNRNEINNFNHKIAYSDDERDDTNENIKKIAFGNLNITVSKKEKENNFNYRNTLIQKTKNDFKIIEESDSSEDEIINNDIVPLIKNTNNNYKKINVIKTLKEIIKDSTFPEKTSICCWWCAHKFDYSPCTLPIDYSSYTKKFKCIGIFCSWNCVKSYNFELRDQKIYERSSYITLIIKQMYSLEYSLSIKPAPPRQMLKMFGGDMSIDEFRYNNKGVDYYKLNLMNNNFIYPEIIEISNINNNYRTKNK
jgi:hypothetical protein